MRLIKHILRPRTDFLLDYHDYTKHQETIKNIECGSILYKSDDLVSNIGPWPDVFSENLVIEDGIILIPPGSAWYNDNDGGLEFTL